MQKGKIIMHKNEERGTFVPLSVFESLHNSRMVALV